MRGLGGASVGWQITLCDPIDKWRPVVSLRTIRSFTFYCFQLLLQLQLTTLIFSVIIVVTVSINCNYTAACCSRCFVRCRSLNMWRSYWDLAGIVRTSWRWPWRPQFQSRGSAENRKNSSIDLPSTANRQPRLLLDQQIPRHALDFCE